MKYTVKKIGDDILTFKRIGMNPFANSDRSFDWVRKPDTNVFIRKEQYQSTILKNEKKFENVELKAGYYKLITLETKDTISMAEFQKEIKKFILNFKYNFGHIEYISAKECYEKGFDRYHCHIIMIFDTIAPSLSRKWLEEHWPFGFVHICNSWYYEGKEVGAVEYLTLDKKNNYQPDNPKLTKFPSNTKIINASQNLPRYAVEEMECKKSEFDELQKVIEQARQSKNLRVRTNGHHYSKDNFCLDNGIIYGKDAGKLYENLSKDSKEENILFEDI